MSLSAPTGAALAALPAAAALTALTALSAAVAIAAAGTARNSSLLLPGGRLECFPAGLPPGCLAPRRCGSRPGHDPRRCELRQRRPLAPTTTARQTARCPIVICSTTATPADGTFTSSVATARSPAVAGVLRSAAAAAAQAATTPPPPSRWAFGLAGTFLNTATNQGRSRMHQRPPDDGGVVVDRTRRASSSPSPSPRATEICGEA